MRYCEIDMNGYFLCDAPHVTESAVNIAPHAASDGTIPNGMRKARFTGAWNAVASVWVGGSWIDEEATALVAELAAQQLSAMESRLEAYTDTVARQRRYRSAESCVSYVGDAAPQIDAEAIAFKAWRSAFWVQAGIVETDVIAGTRTAPTFDELIAELPQMVWPV